MQDNLGKSSVMPEERACVQLLATELPPVSLYVPPRTSLFTTRGYQARSSWSFCLFLSAVDHALNGHLALIP
jgi:hypothetical protein